MNKLIQSVMQRSVIILIFVVLIVAWGGVAAFQIHPLIRHVRFRPA
ncbi:hypothetical protein ACFSR7_30205 [Cohnella sp. GCM10020058]